MRLIYQNAETAANWMERGDDLNEARAIRVLISEHQQAIELIKALTLSPDDIDAGREAKADIHSNARTFLQQLKA